MPELPEVETTISGIKPYVLAHKITDVIIRQPRLRFPVPILLAQKLVGQCVNNLTRRGKYIVFHFNHGTLIIHLGMSGRLNVLLTPTPPEKHDHVDIIFDNEVCLRLRDPRRFGAVLWLDDINAEKHTLLKNLGPEPLAKSFQAKYLQERAAHKKIAVKAFIMNSNIVVGIGNIYATESLFKARIHPLKAAGKLTYAEWQRVVSAIKTVLKQAIKSGGTTLKDFAQPGGNPGYFAIKLNVYGKHGLPCPNCKTKLKLLRVGQRSTVYCPHCQKR